MRFHDSADSVSFLIVASCSLIVPMSRVSGLLPVPELRLELGGGGARAAARALPRQRLAQLRDLALERVDLAAILLGRRFEPHRLAFAAAQLRELALQVVDVGLQLRDDLRLRLELLLEALDLVILLVARLGQRARGLEVVLERLDHLGLRVQTLLERR